MKTLERPSSFSTFSQSTNSLVTPVPSPRTVAQLVQMKKKPFRSHSRFPSERANNPVEQKASHPRHSQSHIPLPRGSGMTPAPSRRIISESQVRRHRVDAGSSGRPSSQMRATLGLMNIDPALYGDVPTRTPMSGASGERRQRVRHISHGGVVPSMSCCLDQDQDRTSVLRGRDTSVQGTRDGDCSQLPASAAKHSRGPTISAHARVMQDNLSSVASGAPTNRPPRSQRSYLHRRPSGRQGPRHRSEFSVDIHDRAGSPPVPLSDDSLLNVAPHLIPRDVDELMDWHEPTGLASASPSKRRSRTDAPAPGSAHIGGDVDRGTTLLNESPPWVKSSRTTRRIESHSPTADPAAMPSCTASPNDYVLPSLFVPISGLPAQIRNVLVRGSGMAGPMRRECSRLASESVLTTPILHEDVARTICALRGKPFSRSLTSHD
ncbi:hypothetical protein BV25DRAFT_1824940 [Artomyces pyxidatus]|uniref:Uncharacterized protein n=1 Tax=Artomyces pyxidatus TaxID=48021 RepID=A0ACB8T2C1_9AGAM|nr:hypothetical protein BV25DRAFT_1824940 [Artomyces pyxidatus]